MFQFGLVWLTLVGCGLAITVFLMDRMKKWKLEKTFSKQFIAFYIKIE